MRQTDLRKLFHHYDENDRKLHSDVYNSIEVYFTRGILHIGFTDHFEWKHFCEETNKPHSGWTDNGCMFYFEDTPCL